MWTKDFTLGKSCPAREAARSAPLGHRPHLLGGRRGNQPPWRVAEQTPSKHRALESRAWGLRLTQGGAHHFLPDGLASLPEPPASVSSSVKRKVTVISLSEPGLSGRRCFPGHSPGLAAAQEPKSLVTLSTLSMRALDRALLSGPQSLYLEVF